ncbi:hypothetical protein Salat_1782900 [Sesamum alatum]|uniref:Uncharacterized protein n=1 Tax=Sesamum alatum TaxID=300844 RepID=A0AAE1Y8X9_9LAMI|nr:hypothetical protein Salat_1782900 [Sesamum alatum]
MAYNLESLITILQQILHPDNKRWILIRHQRRKMKSLLIKASSLKQILDKSPLASGLMTESLMSEIRDAAHKAEDMIESRMVDLRLSDPGAQSCNISLPNLNRVIKKTCFCYR